MSGLHAFMIRIICGNIGKCAVETIVTRIVLDEDGESVALVHKRTGLGKKVGDGRQADIPAGCPRGVEQGWEQHQDDKPSYSLEIAEWPSPRPDRRRLLTPV